MSQHVATRRLTAPEITARKGKDPIVSLTAYHAHTAAIADKQQWVADQAAVASLPI